MMHAVKRTRRATVAVGATALAFGSLAAVLAQPASAVPASTAITRAILDKQNATPSFKPPARYIDDPDGDLLPNMTPDRAGGFLFYRGGTAGRGAIYAHPRNGSIRARTIYGNILASWELRGWETHDGYPLEDERGATATDRVVCRSAFVTRVQRFARLNSNSATIACFTPGGPGWGVTWFADSRPA